MTIALLLLALGTTVPLWLLPGGGRLPLVGALVGAGVLTGLGVWLLYDPSYVAGDPTLRGTQTVLAGALAVLGGGPVTAALLRRVDDGGPVELAGTVLRGGAWIGAMERAAVFTTIVVGWPEGLAVVLALKGLGRYPELKGAPGHTSGEELAGSGVAERFLIGSAASVIWALACAGVLVGLLR